MSYPPGEQQNILAAPIKSEELAPRECPELLIGKLGYPFEILSGKESWCPQLAVECLMDIFHVKYWGNENTKALGFWQTQFSSNKMGTFWSNTSEFDCLSKETEHFPQMSLQLFVVLVLSFHKVLCKSRQSNIKEIICVYVYNMYMLETKDAVTYSVHRLNTLALHLPE